MQATSRITRGFVCRSGQANARLTLGFICAPLSDVIVPPDFIPTFLIPEQIRGEDSLFNKSILVSKNQYKVSLAVPSLPIFTSPSLVFKENKEPDIFNKEGTVVSQPSTEISNKEDSDIYNKEEPNLIDDP